MESAYWPGNEKKRVATELKRHREIRYMMSGPWNETSCEYYEEIQQLAVLTASREIARGITAHSVVATAVHARYHQKTMECAGTLATARRRVHSMAFAAHSREEARATIEAANVIKAFALLLEPCGTRREPQKHLRAGVSELPPVQTLRVKTPQLS